MKWFERKIYFLKTVIGYITIEEVLWAVLSNVTKKCFQKLRLLFYNFFKFQSVYCFMLLAGVIILINFKAFFSKTL